MKIKRNLQLILSLLAAVCMTAQLGVHAAPAAYSEYKTGGAEISTVRDGVRMKGSDFSACTDSALTAEGDGSITLGADETVHYFFNVTSDSIYYIYLSYAAIEDNKSKLNIGI